MCKKIKEKLKGKLNKKNMKLLLYIICLLVFTSGDYILYVNWIDSMKNYNIFFNYHIILKIYIILFLFINCGY